MRFRTGWIGSLLGMTALGVALCGVARTVPAQDAQPQKEKATLEELRAIWVPAPSAPLTDPHAAEQMIAEVRSAKFNTLIVQVRSLDDAFYQSSFVPRSPALGSNYPDPLKWILDRVGGSSEGEAKESLRVVAAVEILRVHNTALRSRPAPESVLSRHPNWVALNAENKAIGPDQHMWLEPGLKAVRDYLAAVVREIAGQYEVDGIYLSGIRYPGTSAKWGYHPEVLQEFRSKYPDAPERPEAANPQWIEFRKAHLEQLVTELTAAVRQARPECQVFIGAEVENPAPATLDEWSRGPVAAGMLQDWVSWGQKGLVDWICVKNLQQAGTTSGQFDAWLTFATRAGMRTRVCAGIAGGQNFITGILNQIRSVQTAGLAGIVLYDYQKPTAEQRELLMSHLGRTVFAQSRQAIKLMNIVYSPPVTPTPADYAPTTPTLVVASPPPPPAEAPAATPEEEREIAMEAEPPAMEPAETEPPPPLPTPAMVLPTPTPLAVPMQTFRLKNGLTFKGRIVVEVEGKVTIVTEDGAQLKIPRGQIVSPPLSVGPQ